MINLTLYGRGMRSSWKMLVVFAAILAMYFSVIIWMYDPELKVTLEQLSTTMPEMMAAFGMNLPDSTLTGFLASYLYGFLMLVFPMVFSILTANRLVAAAVDRGWMAYLLASPNRRAKIALTQGKVLGSGLFLLVVFAALYGLCLSAWMFPGELDIKGYLWLNAGALALQLFVGGFCFFSSCLFNETKYSIALGAGVPCLAYLVHMLAGIGDKLENFKYGTFFTLYSPDNLLAGEASAYWGIGILAVAGLVFFLLGTLVFSKRDLPV